MRLGRSRIAPSPSRAPPPPRPRQVYARLLRAYGPQGWWPVTPRGRASPVYRPGHEAALTERERAEICVGAILTQNTNWGNVQRALEGLHGAGVWGLQDILRLPSRRLKSLIRPSGYFRQKARKLKVFARHALKSSPRSAALAAGASRPRSLGAWLSGPLKSLRLELLGLWGVGPETADSILLYAGGRPVFVVDAYTMRIGSRLGWFGKQGYERVSAYLLRRLPASPRLYAELHALLVALAKGHCRAKPVCAGCPLLELCRHGQAALRAGAAALALWLAAGPACAGTFYAAAGKTDITPDLKRETAWLAGYGASGRKAVGVHDPLYARALLVSDGTTTVALVGVDLIGLFREDVEEMRRRLGWTGPRRYLLVSATHQHSGPDTLGLWGRWPGVSGVDRRYRRRLLEGVVSLVRELSSRLTEAELFAAKTELDPRGLCRDIRDPVVLDPELNVLQLRAKARPGAAGAKGSSAAGAVIGTLVRWSCHPEALREDNRLLSADYPGELCARVEERTGGACLFESGAIGGLLVADSDRSPARQFSEAGRIGRTLADAALKALAFAARWGEGRVAFSSRRIRLPIENSRYLLFLRSLAFGHRLRDARGEALSLWRTYWLPLRHLLFFPLPERLRPWVESEVSHVRLGQVEILGIPGEIFPELVLGGYDGRYRFGAPLVGPANPNPPRLSEAPKGPWLREKFKARHGLVVGLANDELGYIVPEYDFQITGNRSLEPHPPGTHYEETNSIGMRATRIILEAAEELLRGP